MQCNICSTEIGDPLYEATSNHSLTSLCELRPERLKVWLCSKCGHLSGESLRNTENYYDTEYRILLDHDDEDQIYEVDGDKIVYRTDHQVTVFLSKLSPNEGARILDFGCAKASTPRRLLVSRPDLKVHLFDVSSMYIPHWEKFLPKDNWAVHKTPNEWCGTFDLVTSFFALEHIPDPVNTVKMVANLLTVDGVFYGVVPDTFGNVADFIVIDHVNHFTEYSLGVLLRSGGFQEIKIDAESHRGALIFTARKGGMALQHADLMGSLDASRHLASYWKRTEDRIRDAELSNARKPAAIYGSGFYGAYIGSTLQYPEDLCCFIDASPFRQGRSLFGHPIIPPSQLPETVSQLYIGLNPKIARSTVRGMEWLNHRNLRLVYLDEASS